MKYKPQKRDDLIIGLIDQYGRLDTYQLLALLQPCGLRNLRRRLQYMFHDKPPLVHRQRHDPDPIVYSITNAGREKLAKGKLPPKKTPGREHIDHTLMITRFRATLDLALQPQKKNSPHPLAKRKPRPQSSYQNQRPALGRKTRRLLHHPTPRQNPSLLPRS